MPDYNESTSNAHIWQRCKQIVIDNTRGAVPCVRFDEERVVAIEGASELRTPLSGMTVAFDPGREIPLLDPATGAPLGPTTTYGAVYAILYSAYMAAAAARDAANAPNPLLQPEA